MDYRSQRKNALKDAEQRFPSRAMQWKDGYLCFNDTGLVVDGSPYVPKAKVVEPEPAHPAWIDRFKSSSGTTRARPASRPRS